MQCQSISCYHIIHDIDYIFGWGEFVVNMRVVTGIVLGALCSAVLVIAIVLSRLSDRAIHRVITDQKIVALTYDDGPALLSTGLVLDILKKHEISATFFVVGKNAEKYPDLIRRTYAEGHEIGNHSWEHERFAKETPFSINRSMSKVDHVLRELGYQGIIHFRSPYGQRPLQLSLVLYFMKRNNILFDVIPNDWELPGVDTIVERVLEQVHPGSIILLHDGGGLDRS